MKEQYIQPQGEQNKAEEMMTPEQLELSKERVKGFKLKLENLIEEEEEKSQKFMEAVEGNVNGYFNGYAEDIKKLKEIVAHFDEFLEK
jgi:hypothetical protein